MSLRGVGAQRRRRAGGHDTSVAELYGCLDGWLGSEGTRDIKSLMATFKAAVTRRTAPSADLLVPLADLARRLAAVAPDTFVQPKKLERAH